MAQILRRIAALAALAALICLIAVPAPAEDVIDVTLAAGERWTVPADRLGSCVISDESVLRLEDGALVAVRPGRAEARMSGSCPTLFRVLVLFSSAAEPAAEPAETVSAVHYFAASDGSDDYEEALTGTAPSGPEAQEEEPAPEDEDADSEEEEEAPEEEPETPELPPESTSGDEPAGDAPEAPEAAEAGDSDPALQAYPRGEVPEQINTVIDFALNEWREAGNKAFSRAGSKNKYSYWQCGKGPKCNIGWCGAFLGYCFDTCGVPMDEPTKSVPHENGEPYSVRAAGVGKINKGFERMNRLTTVPRPGYLVVHGQRRGYGYKHIGLVTDVDDLGGGVYLLKTVEGNMSNRIKRYCYLYDTNEKVKNTKPCPDEYELDNGEINDYQHIKDWTITTFCQTWF